MGTSFVCSREPNPNFYADPAELVSGVPKTTSLPPRLAQGGDGDIAPPLSCPTPVRPHQSNNLEQLREDDECLPGGGLAPLHSHTPDRLSKLFQVIAPVWQQRRGTRQGWSDVPVNPCANRGGRLVVLGLPILGSTNFRAVWCEGGVNLLVLQLLEKKQRNTN